MPLKLPITYDGRNPHGRTTTRGVLLRVSHSTEFDVVIAGAGMGGLAAGALLARAGKRVLVAERHDRPGGYAHGFERDGYHFDVAVHMTSGARGGFLDRVLRAIDARDVCDFIELNPIYTVALPDFSLNVRGGLEGFLDSHVRHFPDEREGLIGFLRLCSKTNRETVHLPPDPAWLEEDIDRTVYPLHDRYRHATLAEVVDEYIRDSRLKTLLTALWVYQGLPPSQLSFLAFAPMLVSYLATGSFYCRGSFQRLANAFAGALSAHGGELALSTDVERILVEDGELRGVVLAGGITAQAPVVISNVDARQTFERLVGPSPISSEYLQRLDGLETSLSAVALYLGTDVEVELDSEAAHEIFVFDDWDYDTVFQSIHDGRPAAVSVTIPSKVDHTLAPAGTDVVSIIGLAPYDPDPPWDTETSTAFQDAMLDAAETAVPGLSDHIKLRIGAHPGTMERFTLNQRGAMYGWAHVPEQAAGYRLEHRTPVPGLFLAGHWSQPGGGIVAATVSGALVAQLVLEHDDLEAMLTTLTDRPRTSLIIV